MVQVGPESPTMYSIFIALSNEAFALSLLKHYRLLPLAKQMKGFKVTKLIKKEKQQDKGNNEEREAMMKKRRTNRSKRGQ